MHYTPVWSAPEVQNFTAEKSYKATTKATKLRNLYGKRSLEKKLQNGDSIHIPSLY